MSEIIIRKAVVADGEAVAHLLKELGYPNTRAFCEGKLARLSRSQGDSVLVAEVSGSMVGAVHLHVAELFHKPGLMGRLMAIVVTEKARGSGVGQKLMASAEMIAQGAGCVMMEVTSGLQRHRAHAFYQELGYVEERKRFVKTLERESPPSRGSLPFNGTSQVKGEFEDTEEIVKTSPEKELIVEMLEQEKDHEEG